MSSEEEEVQALCEEVIEDIELSRCGLEHVLLKASRIARLLDDEETWQWLQWELHGYPAESTLLSQGYARRTNRKSPWWDAVLDEQLSEKWYPYPVAQIMSGIQNARDEIEGSSGKSFTGEYAVIAQREHFARLKGFHEATSRLEQVRSGIQSLVYDYVTRVLDTKRFSGVSESIFGAFRTQVDLVIAAADPEIPQMLESVYARLVEGDSEATSQALTTCRRILDSYADGVFPPQEEPVIVCNEEIDCGPGKQKNRLLALLGQKVSSKTRRKRLKQNLFNLYARLSTGVHDEVHADEAKALVLNTYLLLGELASLPEADLAAQEHE